MLIRSGDIRDQSRKLSKIAPKFGSLLALRNFKGRTLQTWSTHYHPSLAARSLEKFCEGTPTSREVMGAHTLHRILFSRLIFGGPRPRCGVRYVALLNL